MTAVPATSLTLPMPYPCPEPCRANSFGVCCHGRQVYLSPSFIYRVPLAVQPHHVRREYPVSGAAPVALFGPGGFVGWADRGQAMATRDCRAAEHARRVQVDEEDEE